ncbi:MULTISPECIES: molecular chaperone [unclassified Rickettsia]|uniref:fimbrial biogenesis chaperone n=1 Tax=unclassified Rickettsia TaxID=114295 RepID=UPI00209EA982|nr:fimbria/pilus periplasmic chaperone [Rickettsia endosymbiont of Ceutorhynchus assimilis]
MKKQFYSLLTLILICLTSSVVQAVFTIAPVKLTINKDNRIANLNLRNDNDVPKSFQLIIYKVEYKNGKEVLKETEDLIATPVMFRIGAGRTQLVRIALINKMSYSRDQDAYRIAVKELPHRQAGIQSQVQFVVEFRVPVTIG